MTHNHIWFIHLPEIICPIFCANMLLKCWHIKDFINLHHSNKSISSAINACWDTLQSLPWVTHQWAETMWLLRKAVAHILSTTFPIKRLHKKKRIFYHEDTGNVLSCFCLVFSHSIVILKWVFKKNEQRSVKRITSKYILL